LLTLKLAACVDYKCDDYPTVNPDFISTKCQNAAFVLLQRSIMYLFATQPPCLLFLTCPFRDALNGQLLFNQHPKDEGDRSRNKKTPAMG
jgi:hypothetical protein